MGDELVRLAVNGDSGDSTTAEAIGHAAKRLDDIATEMKSAKASDTARFDALQEEQKAQAATLSGLKIKHDEEVREATLQEASADAKAALKMASGLREPSKARQIGTGAHSFGNMGYRAGQFLAAVYELNRHGAFDAERQAAKATLVTLGSQYMTPDEAGSKATLGTTDATGGWVVPNAIVEPLTRPGRYRLGVDRLVTHRQGLENQFSIDIPFRRGAPTRAVVAPWGDQKELRSLAYEGYTATLYTIAAIYDVAKQFVRKSQGAAEEDVIAELTDAFAQGRAYYILQGSGSSEPYGLQTALALGGASAYTSSFTASATTLAGSIANAIATAGGALAGRNQSANGAVMGAAAYWTMLAQGTDTAGFWFAGQRGGSPEGINPNTLITPFGIPVVPETQLAGADDMIVGDWSQLKVYEGQGLRIDVSEVAGERWDKNLVGFRGEGEMALDARPAVFAGAFQFIADIVP